MMRKCDGADENLTRQVRRDNFDPESMTANQMWAFTAQPGCVVINCQCGTRFDDVLRLMTYPHEYKGQKPLFEP